MRRRTMTAGLLTGLIGPAALPRAARAARGPLVLELFTSQGCSSCPPADALLGELIQDPGVIGLAWHVDYWNRSGWADPFANRLWSDRQRAYARLLRAEVYTPALVVNGSVMVVGSNRRSVGAAMQAAPGLTVPMSLRRTGVQLEAEVGRMPAGGSLSLAVYDPEHTTVIGGGENGGRRLREFRMVRGNYAIWNRRRATSCCPASTSPRAPRCCCVDRPASLPGPPRSGSATVSEWRRRSRKSGAAARPTPTASNERREVPGSAAAASQRTACSGPVCFVTASNPPATRQAPEGPVVLSTSVRILIHDCGKI